MDSDIRDEIRSVGRKVDAMALSAEADRELLKRLHADHVRLEARVATIDTHLSKTRSDLDAHIEIACVIQDATRKDVAEIKDTLKSHTIQEDNDRREIMRHLRDQATRSQQEGKATLMWAIGVGVSVVLALFVLLWGTGAVAVR
jgi:sorbitol-specific phosphotransferase system component IIBC